MAPSLYSQGRSQRLLRPIPREVQQESVLDRMLSQQALDRLIMITERRAATAVRDAREAAAIRQALAMAGNPLSRQGIDLVRMPARIGGRVFENPWLRVGGFRNPWVLPYGILTEMVRQGGGPPGQLVASFIPQLFRMHPALRLIDLALLAREFDAQATGKAGTAQRVVQQGSAPPADPAIILPPGWTATMCSGEALAGVIGWSLEFGSLNFQPGTCGILVGNAAFPGIQSLSDAQLWMGAPGTLARPRGQVLEPGIETFPGSGFYQSRLYRGFVEAPNGWTPADGLPEPEGAQRPLVQSPVGLGAPNPLERARRALGRFGLPGGQGGEQNLPWGQQREVDAWREQLGLRAVFYRPHDPLPSPAPPSQWGSLVQIEGGGAEVYPRPGVKDPHQFAPPPPRVREHKVLTSSAYVAAKVVMNAFTETNDFVRELWSALPRECRRARANEKGNRRTDQMLRDLYRCSDRIDWPLALVNVLKNEAEDLFYGTAGRYAMEARRRAAGGGLGGGAVTGQGRAGTEGGMGPGDSPLDTVLDAWGDVALSGARAIQRAFGG